MSFPIPLEVVELAIDSLHDDIHALSACALTSRALLPRARFHIWREVTVLIEGYPQHPRIQELLKILDASPDIAAVVQSFTLNGVVSPQSRNRTHDYWDDPEGAMLLWEKLPNLRELKLDLLTFKNGLHQLIPFVYSLPNLETLALVGFYAAPEPKTTDPAFAPYRDSIVQLRTPPKLKRLSLTPGWVSWLFMEDLAKLLLERGMHAPLETLDLSCTVTSLNTGRIPRHSTETLPSQAWAPVIVSLAPTLRHCTLGLLTQECYPANLANLYRSLKHCTHLRSLGLVCNIHPAVAVSPHLFLFLDALADLLQSVPPPFPHLNALSLELLQTNEFVLDGCADTCSKLASALEDRTRYPHLKRLDVCAKTKKHTGTVDGYLSVEERMKEQEAIIRSCFETVEEVGVHVEIMTGPES